jgi:hypothetical protein
MILTDRKRPVYRKSGLLFLLAYAIAHKHSAKWIPALLTILARQEVTHG